MPAAPWRARIRTVDGQVVGGGVVLAPRRVLTCAHVIDPARGPGDPAPGDTVLVDLIGQRDRGPVGARVLPQGWVARQGDGCGDLALLELAEPVPAGLAAPLRRIAMSPGRHRQVWTFGFPRDIEFGRYVRATLAGASGPDGEWVQLDTAVPGPAVERGFSGSGVLDEATRSVVGVVVAEFTDRSDGLSWMIPVETITKYLPQVLDWVNDASPVDPLFTGSGAGPVDDDVLRQIMDFFAGRVDAKVLTVVTGDSDSSAFAALCRAVVLTQGGARSIGQHGAAGTAARQGAPIDLAIDAAGKTADEVARRIIDGVGIATGDAPPSAQRLIEEAVPMAIVVDRVDAASDPPALLSEVLLPLANQAAGADIRLVLGFRSESSHSLDVISRVTSARSVRSEAPPDPGPTPTVHRSPAETAALDALAARLDDLATRIAAVAAAERAARRSHAHVAARVQPVPDPPDRHLALRVHLTELRTALHDTRHADPDPTLTPHRITTAIDRCERVVERAGHEVATFEQRLEALLAERGELRGRLESYKARLLGHGPAEDLATAELYRHARSLLWRGPCDLRVAAAAVDRYAHAVWRGVDGAPPADRTSP